MGMPIMLSKRYVRLSVRVLIVVSLWNCVGAWLVIAENYPPAIVLVPAYVMVVLISVLPRGSRSR